MFKISADQLPAGVKPLADAQELFYDVQRFLYHSWVIEVIPRRTVFDVRLTSPSNWSETNIYCQRREVKDALYDGIHYIDRLRRLARIEEEEAR